MGAFSSTGVSKLVFSETRYKTTPLIAIKLIKLLV